jgi:hypothetical protein
VVRSESLLSIDRERKIRLSLIPRPAFVKIIRRGKRKDRVGGREGGITFAEVQCSGLLSSNIGV